MSVTLEEAMAIVEEFKEVEEVDGLALEEVAKIAKGEDSIALPEEMTVEQEGAEKRDPEGEDTRDLRTRLGDMKIPEKIKLAMFGNQICRTLLIRDPNRMIPMFVLKNPKLQVKEIEEFSRNRNLNDLVLRRIADNPRWMKEYKIKLNLVTNPKTPADISLKWVRHLTIADLKKLAKSKSIPQILAVFARKRVMDFEQKQKG